MKETEVVFQAYVDSDGKVYVFIPEKDFESVAAPEGIYMLKQKSQVKLMK